MDIDKKRRNSHGEEKKIDEQSYLRLLNYLSAVMGNPSASRCDFEFGSK